MAGQKMENSNLSGPGKRIYCTYFDSNYIHRGLALHSSLRVHGGSFSLYVLCLDTAAVHSLRALDLPEIVPVPIAELEAADPELAATRSNRSLVEYYFTCTGSFCRYVLFSDPGHWEVTYLDSDLFFFESPELVFNEIGDASIAITPHRFTERTYRNRQCGIFNVGWITWRRDDEGIRCLEDYRRQCIAWCHDYCDGLRFADQRYLDTWPVDYQGVCVISHPGANVAVWNLDAAPMAVNGGKVLVAGQPLVFFHFHRHKRRPDGGFDRHEAAYFADRSALPAAEVLEAIFAPYEAVLNELGEAGGKASIRAATRHPLADLPEWEFQPDGWSNDRGLAPGWNAPSAVAALEWRATIVRRRLGTPLPMGGDLNMHNQTMVLAYAVARAGLGRDRLSVLDWQGGVGGVHLQMKGLVPELAVDYLCVTSSEMAKRDRSSVPDAEFTDDENVAFGREYDVVIANGTLQYEPDWENTLRRLAACARRWLLVTRLPLVASVPSFVTLRRMYRSDYGTAFQSWAINIRRFETILTQGGMTADRQFISPERPYVPGAPEQFETMSFLYRRDPS
jgi:putative methyltransferase (TIGR04325 family)